MAGIVHQERNVTYVLVKGAGHEVPEYQPESVSCSIGLNWRNVVDSNG